MKVIYSEETRLPPFLRSIVRHLYPITIYPDVTANNGGNGGGERNGYNRWFAVRRCSASDEGERNTWRASGLCHGLFEPHGWLDTLPSATPPATTAFYAKRRYQGAGIAFHLSAPQTGTTSHRCATYGSHMRRTHPIITFAFPVTTRRHPRNELRTLGSREGGTVRARSRRA